MWLRIPLHFKLALSYLLVVGLVLLPTAVYLQTSIRNDQRAKARAELGEQLRGISLRLGEATPEELPRRAALLLMAFPARLTVLDAEGDVIGDSAAPGVVLPNHADRPEIRDALARGTGTAVRRSSVTNEPMLYVATRFPSRGAPRGVARLSRPLAVIEGSNDALERVLRNTAGLALTVAVLLSLLAALVVSRPLHRIAHAARAFADGDFGASPEVDSNDEIGEVAQALDTLAAQLRTKLLASGADRATLFALLDEVPVGVVLYDDRLRPVRINGAARRALNLSAHDEVALAAELASAGGLAATLAEVLDDAVSREVEAALPWAPGVTVCVRWVAVYEAGGARTLAAVVTDRRADRERDRVESRLADAADALADAASSLASGLAAARCADAAIDARAAVTRPAPAPGHVEGAPVGALLDRAESMLRPRLELAQVRVERQVPDPDARVIEAEGRVALALALTLRQAALEGSTRVSLRVSLDEASLRIAARSRLAVDGPAPGVEALVAPLGGSSGHLVDDDRVERWVVVPRA